MVVLEDLPRKSFSVTQQHCTRTVFIALVDVGGVVDLEVGVDVVEEVDVAEVAVVEAVATSPP